MAVPVRALLPMLLLTTQQGLGSTFAHSSRRRDEWGPAHLQETCEDGICHRYGKMSAPLDHEDPSEGEWELVYFVNSDYWDPVAKPGAPIFVNMGYGATDVEGYTAGALFRIDGATFARGFPGATPELAAELGALIINVPNRYYGCNTARAGRDEGTCPTSLGSIPAGEDGVLEAHERLRYLSLTAVVDDIALVARETVTTYARDWGMQLVAGAGAGTGGVRGRAPNQPIIFGCSWPGAAAVYGRMLYPELFAGAVATSHPLVSSPEGNNHYRTFIGAVYELYSAGGSLECKNVVQVGHEEIKRRLVRPPRMLCYSCLRLMMVPSTPHRPRPRPCYACAHSACSSPPPVACRLHAPHIGDGGRSDRACGQLRPLRFRQLLHPRLRRVRNSQPGLRARGGRVAHLRNRRARAATRAGGLVTGIGASMCSRRVPSIMIDYRSED